MELELIKINPKDSNILERIMQLYLHDLSLYFPIDFEEKSGLYLYDSLEKYFDESENCGYFIKSNKEIAGFILLEKTENNYIIQEMFVLNHHKSNGIGKKAVNYILNKYSGYWLIKSLPCSEPAEKFWKKTIKEYTNNNYSIAHVGKYNRAVFSFNNSDK